MPVALLAKLTHFLPCTAPLAFFHCLVPVIHLPVVLVCAGDSPMLAAASRGHDALLRLLLTHDAKVDLLNKVAHSVCARLL